MVRIVLSLALLAGCGARAMSSHEAHQALDQLGEVRRGPDESWRPALAAFCSAHAACAGECHDGLRDFATNSWSTRAEVLIEECAPLRRRIPSDRLDLRAALAEDFVVERVDAYLAQVRPALDMFGQRELDQLRADLGL